MPCAHKSHRLLAISGRVEEMIQPPHINIFRFPCWNLDPWVSNGVSAQVLFSLLLSYLHPLWSSPLSRIPNCRAASGCLEELANKSSFPVFPHRKQEPNRNYQITAKPVNWATKYKAFRPFSSATGDIQLARAEL